MSALPANLATMTDTETAALVLAAQHYRYPAARDTHALERLDAEVIAQLPDVVTILLGMAGALLAAFVGQIMGFYAPGQRASFIAAVLGAIAVLALYRWFSVRR